MSVQAQSLEAREPVVIERVAALDPIAIVRLLALPPVMLPFVVGETLTESAEYPGLWS